MMKNRLYFLGGATFVLVIVMITVFGFHGSAVADETRIIRVYADMSRGFSARLEPKNIWVKPGTVIVWNNWGKKEISITFKNGKECDGATTSQMGFKFDPAKACIITNQYIPYGGTASMKFDKIGEYRYVVDFIEQNATEEGSISVRADQ